MKFLKVEKHIHIDVFEIDKLDTLRRRVYEKIQRENYEHGFVFKCRRREEEESKNKMSISTHLIHTNEKKVVETIDLTAIDTSMDMSSLFDDEEEEE
jgi:hypothetical protein